MIPKRLSRLISSILVTMLTITSTVYAEPQRQEIVPYGPKVESLKGREEILRIFRQLKAVRASLINIKITEKTTDEELDAINAQLEVYLGQFDAIRNNIERYKITYRDSFEDVFFAERLSFIAHSFTLSIIGQQSLIRALKDGKVNAENLVYSSYLIPVYNYLAMGDQIIAYIEVYFVIS